MKKQEGMFEDTNKQLDELFKSWANIFSAPKTNKMKTKIKHGFYTMVLIFGIVSCSDTMDIEDCGCVETYSYSSIITINGLPKTSYYKSEPKSVPCQDESEWKEKSSNNSIIGGYIDYKITCK